MITGSNVSGSNPAAVFDALRERLKHNRRDDGRRIALVVEGGSMRGVHSAGAMVALARLGYTDLFDRIYATSAGVMNASYFLSHQPDLGFSVYSDSLCCKAFINPWRPWKMVDIDWLFRQVIALDKPLDVSRVMASPVEFYVTMMNRATAQSRVIHVQSSREPMTKLLKAAVAAPVFYNRSVTINGERCIDGGLLHGLPIEPALAGGCTDALVLMTRRQIAPATTPPWWSRQVFNLLAAPRNSSMRKIFADYNRRDEALRTLVMTGRPIAGDGTTPRANIATILPPEPLLSPWAVADRSAVIAAGDRSRDAMFKIMANGG